MIENQPDLLPSKEHLLEIVRECLKAGCLVVNDPAKYPICPDCGTSSEYLQQEVVDDEGCPIVITSCPVCGWIQGIELRREQ